MSEPNVYSGGGLAIGANAQATGAGGHIYNHAPPAPSGRVIAIRDADLEAIMMQFAKLQAALHLSKAGDAEHIGNEVTALSQDVGATKRVGQSRVSSLLSAPLSSRRRYTGLMRICGRPSSFSTATY